MRLTPADKIEYQRSWCIRYPVTERKFVLVETGMTMYERIIKERKGYTRLAHFSNLSSFRKFYKVTGREKRHIGIVVG